MGMIAVDRVNVDRPFMESQLVNFVQTDTICYRNDHPSAETLYKRQLECWDPLNEWFAENFGGEKLLTTTGLGVAKQPQVAIDAVTTHKIVMFIKPEFFPFPLAFCLWHETIRRVQVTKYIADLNEWQLAAFDTTTAVTKSIVLSLALAEGKFTAEEISRFARLEEDFQSDLYGFVEGGHDWDVATTNIRLASAELVFRSLEAEENTGYECLMKALQEQDKVQ